MTRRMSKVAPQIKKEETHEEEEENVKTEEDRPEFLNKLATEAYITFAEFCKYLSLFNPKTGLDEKIQCKNLKLDNYSLLQII